MKRRLTMLLAGLFLFVGAALAQKNISGTVVSADDGEPIIGASVKAVGATVGVQTDIDGKFSFTLPAGETKIVVSYVGMQTQTVAAASNMKITLKRDNKQLDEVVVTAMGITRKQKSLGYSTQEIKADKLQTTRVTDVGNALAGKVSGARFYGASGATFDAGAIVLRGTTTLTPAGSEPIYVVDGVITNKNMINMDDVASLNVLKGPAATALYGSQGDNGAVIITTKGISSGNQQIDISHTIIFNKPYNHYKMQQEYGGGYGMSTYTFNPATDPAEWKVLDGKRFYDYAYDESWGAKYDGEEYIPYYAWDSTSPYYLQTARWESPGEDNMNHLLRTGMVNTTNVAFAKAGKDYMSRISFTNTSNKGIIPNSDAAKRFLSVRTSFKPLDHLNVDLDFKYTYSKTHNAAVEAYNEGDGAMFPSMTQWFNTNVDINMMKDYRRPDGSFRSWNINNRYNFTPAFHNNPFAVFDNRNAYDIYQWNVFRAAATYDILKNLKVGLAVNGNIRSYRGELKTAMGFVAMTSGFKETQNTLNDISTIGSIAYNTDFLNKRLTWNIAGFVESRYYHFEKLYGYTTDGLLVDNFYNMSASVGKPMAENTKSSYRTQSLYANTTLGLDDTYFLELSARNDWDSRLPKDKNNYFYGGASATVLMSNILPKNNVLTFWKLRASLAQVGSTLNPYSLYDMYDIKKFGATGYMINQKVLRNPNIKPTISTSYEVGTEFRMFKNRLWGDINYYSRNTKNQIINLNITPASGFNSNTMNAGQIRNQGIEVMIGGRPIETKNWSWELTGNIAHNSNKLIELSDGVDRYRLFWYGYSTTLYQFAEVGKPVGTLYGSDWKRDPDGNIIMRKLSGASAEKNGEYIPVQDKNAMNYLGNVQPDLTGGFGTSLRWKNLTLSMSLDFQAGGKIASTTNMFGEFSGMLESTAGKNDRGGDIRGALKDNGGILVKGVYNTGTAEKPVYTPVESYVNANVYFEQLKGALWSPYVYDASYVKMREISLSYEFPKTLLAKTKVIKQASISLVAQNPWLIYSAMPNVDASEVGNAYAGCLERGQAMSTRSFGCTVKLTL